MNIISEIFEEGYPQAMREAAYEAFEGKLTSEQLNQKVDQDQILAKALSLLEN